MIDKKEKLPQWVDEWIAENEIFGCIDAGLVRDFLAKFVLCQRDSSAVMHEHTGELVLAQDAAYWGTNWIALHAPATEVPK